MTINKLITPYNRWEGRNGYSVQWIVIHYTAGYNDTAEGNARLFASKYLGASAHYFVDDSSVWQSVLDNDTAWGVGDNISKNGCINYNSINIEMCSKWDAYPDMAHIAIGSDYTEYSTGARGVYYISDATICNTVELVKSLLKQYPNAKLCRHYDVTGKRCPMPWVEHSELWDDFLIKLKGEEPMTDAEKKAFEELQKEVKALKSENTTLKSEITVLKKTDSTISKKVSKIESLVLPKWNSVDEADAWVKPTLQKLINKGYLKGTKNGLEISYQLGRELVINDRAGTYDS